MPGPRQQRPKCGRRSAQEPGARFLAWFCLLLVTIASTAQALHVHGSYAPNQHALAGQHDAGALNGDESVCPLCVAMHSALPATVSLAAGSVELQPAATPALLVTFVREPAHFAGFSRPPPAAAL